MPRDRFFDSLARESSPLAFRPEHEPRIEKIRRRLGDLRGKRVFEPGCGAGPFTVLLAEWIGTSGRLLALDACPGMVAQCIRAVTPQPHVRILHGRAEDAPLEPAAWDLILCFRLFPHLADPNRFLRQCRTWLAPGGELVIANLEGSSELNGIHAERFGVHHDRMPTGAELRRRLVADCWDVPEVHDASDDFFLRARPAARPSV